MLSSYEIICGVDKVKNILSASIIPCVLFYSEGEFIAEFKSSLFDTKGYNFLSDSNFNFGNVLQKDLPHILFILMNTRLSLQE